MRDCAGWFRRGRVVLICGALALVVVGCGGGVEEAGEEPAQAQPEGPQAEEAPTEEEKEPSLLILGEVVSIYPEDGFVLIRKYGGGPLPVNYAFMAVSKSGKSVNLKPSGERIGRFHAADIQGEAPAVGDRILARRMPGMAAEVSPESSLGAESQPIAPSGESGAQ